MGRDDQVHVQRWAARAEHRISVEIVELMLNVKARERAQWARCSSSGMNCLRVSQGGKWVYTSGAHFTIDSQARRHTRCLGVHLSSRGQDINIEIVEEN